QSLITKQLEKTGEKTSDNKSEENKDKDEKKDKEPDEGDEKSRFLKLIHDTLIDNEVDEKYVNDLLDEIGKIQKPDLSIDFLLVNIYQKMILNFGEPALIEKKGEKAETVFFLGPTGVGKTTTIAKIASDFCVEKKVDVALITTDTYRVKAAEQLRTYADILGIPFRIVYTVEDMESALTEFEDYDYIFIDTAGHSPRNKELFEDQERFIALAKKKLNVEIYLVLSVTTKYRDLLKTADLYTHSGDFRMIFTKLDETDALGSILNMKLNTGADLSYITDGQDVPDDFSIFNAQKTVRLLLGGKA
ncbi:MAG: flagellar biosynthesis protein FlhF, partial [Lachnospiraceae bacterium]|nr:flagellar biosynthesis protein FlhF [Lachnospiraceae bacterium]